MPAVFLAFLCKELQKNQRNNAFLEGRGEKIKRTNEEPKWRVILIKYINRRIGGILCSQSSMIFDGLGHLLLQAIAQLITSYPIFQGLFLAHPWPGKSTSNTTALCIICICRRAYFQLKLSKVPVLNLCLPGIPSSVLTQFYSQRFPKLNSSLFTPHKPLSLMALQSSPCKFQPPAWYWKLHLYHASPLATSPFLSPPACTCSCSSLCLEHYFSATFALVMPILSVNFSLNILDLKKGFRCTSHILDCLVLTLSFN